MNTRKLAFASILVGVLTLGALPAQAGDGCRPRSGFSIRIGYNLPRYVVRTYHHGRDYGYRSHHHGGGHHGQRYSSHYGSRRGYGRCR